MWKTAKPNWNHLIEFALTRNADWNRSKRTFDDKIAWRFGYLNATVKVAKEKEEEVLWRIVYASSTSAANTEKRFVCRARHKLSIWKAWTIKLSILTIVLLILSIYLIEISININNMRKLWLKTSDKFEFVLIWVIRKGKNVGQKAGRAPIGHGRSSLANAMTVVVHFSAR